MSMISRLRQRHRVRSQNRAIERAIHSAPTQSMRNEIVLIAQRHVS